MQTAASNSLVLTDISSLGRFADSQTKISHGGFYQLIALGLHTKQILTGLGDRLVAMAERAHAFRQMDKLEELSRVLATSSLPKQYEAVGRYYQALSIQRFGHGNVEQAAQLLERVAVNAPSRYRLKALVSLGANSVHRAEYRLASSYYCDAGSFASSQRLYDPHAVVVSPKDMAVIRSLEGDHRGALALLEDLFPLAHAMRAVEPHVYYDYLNSLAVELCAVGRLEEARNASRIVLASPFAGAYPEWRETHDEIQLRGYRSSRATVAFHNATPEASRGRAAQEPGKLMRLPLPERTETRAADSAPGSEPARVLSLHEWKTKMVKQSNGDPQDHNPKPATSKEKQARIKKLGKMTTREKLLRIMTVIGDERVGDDLLLRALLVLEELETDESREG